MKDYVLLAQLCKKSLSKVLKQIIKQIVFHFDSELAIGGFQLDALGCHFVGEIADAHYRSITTGFTRFMVSLFLFCCYEADDDDLKNINAT